jgi:hypothetical protein
MKMTDKHQLTPIKGFLSYSHIDKIYAGKIKSFLEEYGIDVFLAHEDIKISKRWDEEVLKSLRGCDFVLLLLSKNFKESDFTDQETGIAIALDKLIIPTKVDDTDPYGFIDKSQASKLSLNDIEKTQKEIIQLIGDKIEFKDRLIDSLIIGIVNSKSFKECNLKCRLLPPLNKLRKEQIISLVNYGLDSSQFYGSDEGIRILDEIEKKYSELFQKKIIEKIFEKRRICRFRILNGFVFKKSKPAIFGVEVIIGILKSYAAIQDKDGNYIGKIKNIEEEGKIIPEAQTGDKVVVSMEEPTIGRQIDEEDVLTASY